MDRDLQANLVSVSAIGAYLMKFETVLTLLVLVTALVLNLYRIWQVHKKIKSDD